MHESPENRTKLVGPSVAAFRLIQIRPKEQSVTTPVCAPIKDQTWSGRSIRRLLQDPHALRLGSQFAFAALCLWIGIEFHRFVAWGLSGGTLPFTERPPGVEGFLPLSALISLKHWSVTGVVNQVHPAALYILLAAVLVSVAVKKAFCSFLCPIGTLSETPIPTCARAGSELRSQRLMLVTCRSFLTKRKTHES